MRKVIINGMKFVGYLVIGVILALIYSVKYIFTGRSMLGRFIILSFYSGTIVSLIYKPIAFNILVALALLIDIIFSVLMMKSGNNARDEKDNGSNYENTYKTHKTYTNPFFEGMSFEEAKKEYRKLMKKYHPDNIDGSLEMTQKVAEAYSNYCSACGR